jgi:transposase
MTQKRSYKQYPKEFKEEAVALITEQGYTVAKAAEALGVATNMLYRWKENAEKQKAGITLSEDERTELKGLRQEVKILRVEKEILKKASVGSIGHCNSEYYAVHIMCRVMGVSPSAYYAWVKRSGQLISADT